MAGGIKKDGHLPAGVRCSYELCENPFGAVKLMVVDFKGKDGGQDWSSMAGWVLCGTCHSRYNKTGTLEVKRNKPLQPFEKICSNATCKKPENSSQ